MLPIMPTSGVPKIVYSMMFGVVISNVFLHTVFENIIDLLIA